MCVVLWSRMPLMSADEPSGNLLGGSLNAPVRIEVFSDFQCPHCRDLYLGTIKPVLQEYAGKNKVCVIYHEFPLAMHQYSKEASKYVAAAAQLGQQKLIPVFESIFTDQDQWARDGNLDAAVSKALSREDFLKVKKLMQEPGINSSIEKEIQLGVQKDIKSTPTMLISYIGRQQKVEGLVTYTVLKQFIDSIVK